MSIYVSQIPLYHSTLSAFSARQAVCVWEQAAQPSGEADGQDKREYITINEYDNMIHVTDVLAEWSRKNAMEKWRRIKGGIDGKHEAEPHLFRMFTFKRQNEKKETEINFRRIQHI